MKNEIEKMLSERSELLNKVGDQVWHTSLGIYVEQTLRKTGNLSLESLTETIEQEVSRLKESDPERIMAMKALEKLRSIRPPSQ